MRQRSPATETLIRFIREAKMDQNWSFECDRGDAEAYLQRMRVQLYRFKQKLRDRGAKPRQFKILLVSIERPAEKADKDIVTIKMSLSNEKRLDIELTDIFQSLSDKREGTNG